MGGTAKPHSMLLQNSFWYISGHIQKIEERAIHTRDEMFLKGIKYIHVLEATES